MTVIDLVQHNPAVLIVLAVVTGLLVGSFLNVVIYRLPLMMQREWRQQCCEFLELDEKKFSKADPVARHKVFTLAKPDSHCPLCNAPVRPWQNVPIVSYALLRGRCASCKAPISIRYPLIEAVTGLLSGLVAWQFGATALTLALLVLTWSLLWLGLLASAVLPGALVSPRDAVLGAAVGYMSLWSLYWAFKLLTGKEGMGYGDFKLLGTLGAWMGWQSLLLIVILSSLVGAIVGISLLVFRGRDRNIPIPFGPYLAGAGFIALLWGDTFKQLYIQMLTG
jgi:leader peptidase (prepilin peptidase)/N-methyltransferase